MCPLAAVVARLAGVHFYCRFTDGGIVLTMTERNLSPCARWRYRSSPYRRAFLIPFLRRHDRFGGGVEEFVSVCPLAVAVLHHTGVHF